eukprot:3665722-Rhodomonas_salina.1
MSLCQCACACVCVSVRQWQGQWQSVEVSRVCLSRVLSHGSVSVSLTVSVCVFDCVCADRQTERHEVCVSVQTERETKCVCARRLRVAGGRAGRHSQGPRRVPPYQPAVVLRCPYTMSGTDAAYGATRYAVLR